MTSIRPASAHPVPPAIAALLGEDNEGQLEPENSLVMAQKLSHHRSSLAEPYLKSKLRAARTADSSELAQLRKKAGQMGRDFQNLLTAHERQEATVVDLRQKLRALRQELEGREKALDLARRTVERLTAEKGALEAGAAGTQAYVRKLEARLLSVKHAVELQQHCAQLKAQLDSMAHSLHEAEGRASEAEAAAEKATLDAACLKRGLELAAEQLTKSAGAEVPGTLLKAVARGQEEALDLSVQLSDSKQQVAQLATALEQARAHLEAQQVALAQQESDREELRQRADAAEATLEKQRAATAELRRLLDALRPKAGALAEECESLRHDLELERTAAAEAKKEVKELREALRKQAQTEKALRSELWRATALGAGDQAGQRTPPSSRRQTAPGGPGAAQRSPAVRRETAPGGPGLAERSPLPRRETAPGGPGVAERRSFAKSAAAAEAPPYSFRPGAERARQQQKPPPAPQPSKRGGVQHAVAAVAAQSAARVLLRQGITSEHLNQQQQRPEDLSLTQVVSPQTAALLRLQEQRRARRGSQPDAQAEGAAAHQLLDGEGHAPSRASDRGAAEWRQLLQQSPEHAERGGWQEAAQLPGRQHSQRPAALEVPAPPPPPQAVLPVQDDRLMQLYTSALDEQIAGLETELAQLVSSPDLKLSHEQAQAQQQAVAAAAAVKAGAAGGRASAGRKGGQQQQQPGGGAIGAWRPNSSFQVAAVAAVERLGALEQRLMSPGADGPVPNMWRCNPLAANSPPQKEPQQAQQQRVAHGGRAPTAQPQTAGAVEDALVLQPPGTAQQEHHHHPVQQAQQQQQVMQAQLAQQEHTQLVQQAQRVREQHAQQAQEQQAQQAQQQKQAQWVQEQAEQPQQQAEQPQHKQQQQQQQQQGLAGTAGAQAHAAVLPRSIEPAVGAAIAAAAAAAPGAAAQQLRQSDEWLWREAQQAATPPAATQLHLHQQQLLLEAPGSAAASSPSLRLPAISEADNDEEQQSRLQQARPPMQQQPLGQVQQPVAPVQQQPSTSEAASEAQQPPAAARQVQRALQLQQRRPTTSEGSGVDGVASLSRHWELPDDGPGNSDWLSNEFDPDIEQLEVNSCMSTMQRPGTALGASSPGAGAGSSSPHGAAKRPDSSSSYGGGGWSDAEVAERVPLLLPPPAPGQHKLPGAPLGLPPPPRRPATQQQQQQQPLAVLGAAPEAAAPVAAQPSQQRLQHRHTLFDLADMELHELLSES